MRTGKDSARDVRTEIRERGEKTTDLRIKAIANHYLGLPEQDQQSIAEMIVRLMTIRNMGAAMALETIYVIGLHWNGKTNSNRTIKNTKGR
jgi:hypothetical protein